MSVMRFEPFVLRHHLWSAETLRLARDLTARVAADKLTTVRFMWADQHGILRGKTYLAPEFESALFGGVGMSSTMLLKDTSHKTVMPVFGAAAPLGLAALAGAADVVLVADPATFKVLPWAPHSGWILCTPYFKNGQPVEFDACHLLQRQLSRLADKGFTFVSGLEVEFHLFKREPEILSEDDLSLPGQPGTPPRVVSLNRGFQYLTEQRYDELDPLMETLRENLTGLGLPLRSMEIEFGPSQVEMTLAPMAGHRTADAMMLFRSCVKQVCARNGYHATFMCRPAMKNLFSSGWHLHQSLVDTAGGANTFTSTDPLKPLSPNGFHWLAGLLAHAPGATALTTPTINGYKRFRPLSLAPDRITWGQDNRGVMLRVVGEAHDPATRIENRAGEPAANPYLYLASQIASGLDGLERRLDPGASADTPYEGATPLLPRNLPTALAALGADVALGTALGRAFVDYYTLIKQSEIARAGAQADGPDVSDWEQREYFEMF